MVSCSPSSLLLRLSDTVERYIDAHDLCAKQQSHLRRHVRSFLEWQGQFRNGHNDSAAVSAWLASLCEGREPATVNGYRQSILSLIRFDTPDHEPLPRTDRIRRAKEPDQIKAAFTQEEIRRLIEKAPLYNPMSRRVYGHGKAIVEVPHTLPDGTPWSTWWIAFVPVGYDSGQYLGDLLQLKWADIRDDGSATIVRHKTGRMISFCLRPKTLIACKRLGDNKYVLPWRWNLGTYFIKQFGQFVRWAGVRDLTPKSLRRSAITYTYMAHGPEAARMLAGHASFSTTAKHYVDWSIAKRPTVQPPPL